LDIGDWFLSVGCINEREWRETDAASWIGKVPNARAESCKASAHHAECGGTGSGLEIAGVNVGGTACDGTANEFWRNTS
jgi:hypothetical protein